MGLRVRTRNERNRDNSEQDVKRQEEVEQSEPVSPAGRMFIQPHTSCTILCIIGLEEAADVSSIKEGIRQSIGLHPRFSCIPKPDSKGRDRWVKTEVNIDNHVFAPLLPVPHSATAVEDYTAALSCAPPLDPTKPLWEIHVLNVKSGDAAASFILRFHHSLGDGTSLMSLVLASTRKVSNPEELPSVVLPTSSVRAEKRRGSFAALVKSLLQMLLALWHTFTEVGKFAGVSLCFRDSRTPLKGGAGVERMPKRIVSIEVSLEDMKLVKKAMNGTINDVMLAMVSAGITRYLRRKLPKQSFKHLRVHATALVNIRPSPGVQELDEMLKGNSKARWGNQMGYYMLPVPTKEHSDPLQYMRTAMQMSRRKKMSLEPYFTYAGGALLMKLAGAKAAADVVYRSLVQTTLSISNVIGPQEPVMFQGNRITSITPSVVGQPQALCIHMISYAGNVRLVATVAKDIIPDPHILLENCVDMLREMKQAIVKA